MVLTPRMFLMQDAILLLEAKLAKDPGDYMVDFELGELRSKYVLLERRERLGLSVIQGSGQSSNSLTQKTR